MATSAQTNIHVLADSIGPSRIAKPAALLAIALTVIALLLLASLHVLSPEFAPSWRMISEYALGRYGWVLSLMFLSMGLSSCALGAAICQQVQTAAGKVGLWFLIAAGLGGTMASVFDVTHETEHGIAGLLGVVGFPAAASLLSISLGRNETWRGATRGLLWIANLCWVSVLLLVVTLTIMTMQFAKANRGVLPQHAPKFLPPGVLPLDGWADRLIVLSNCTWVLLASYQAIALRRKQALPEKSIGKFEMPR